MRRHATASCGHGVWFRRHTRALISHPQWPLHPLLQSRPPPVISLSVWVKRGKRGEDVWCLIESVMLDFLWSAPRSAALTLSFSELLSFYSPFGLLSLFTSFLSSSPLSLKEKTQSLACFPSAVSLFPPPRCLVFCLWSSLPASQLSVLLPRSA